MTAIGVTSYLLYLNEFILSLISTIVFGKLIILSDAAGIGVYGLGAERSLDDFQHWAGLDFAQRTYLPDAEWRLRSEYCNGAATPVANTIGRSSYGH